MINCCTSLHHARLSRGNSNVSWAAELSKWPPYPQMKILGETVYNVFAHSLVPKFAISMQGKKFASNVMGSFTRAEEKWRQSLQSKDPKP